MLNETDIFSYLNCFGFYKINHVRCTVGYARADCGKTSILCHERGAVQAKRERQLVLNSNKAEVLLNPLGGAVPAPRV